MQIPGGATAWTPELEDCLTAGRYGWAVAAVIGDRQALSWSRPAVFRVEPSTGMPTPPPGGPFGNRTPATLSPAVSTRPSTAEGLAIRTVTAEAFVPDGCVAGGETFTDVPASDPFCRWIEQLARDEITQGCGGGKFCPDGPVTRRQLAMALEQSMRGTPTWAPFPGANPAGNTTTLVDPTPNSVGRYTSLAIGADGLPIVSYHDVTATSLKVMHCNDLACTGQDETITTVDNSGADGIETAIAIGQDGLPIIAYGEGSDLKVAHCNDVACAGQNETITVVEAGAFGVSVSIAIGTDGLPVIAYYDDVADALKVAHCDDTACAGQNEAITLVDDPANNVGQQCSIAIGSDGFPIVSYIDFTAKSLKVAHCDDLACAGQNETITTVEDIANALTLSSIALGVDGLPIIAYADGTAHSLKVAHCNDIACAGQNETITVLDTVTNFIDYVHLTVGADGLPVIVHSAGNPGVMRVTHCNDSACSGQDETRVDAVTGSLAHESIAIGVDGLPLVVYRDSIATNLHVLHCANVFCSPYLRRP
jgi:hypothetical protein